MKRSSGATVSWRVTRTKISNPPLVGGNDAITDSPLSGSRGAEAALDLDLDAPRVREPDADHASDRWHGTARNAAAFTCICGGRPRDVQRDCA